MLDVIGAGFGRTGTYSLKTALTRLGYGPCHHMTSLGEDPNLLRHWEAVVAGQPVQWERVLSGYRSAVDWPVAAYWRQLAAAYPTAKIILTVRCPHRWYASMQRTLYRSSGPASPGMNGLLMWMEDRLDPYLRRRRQISREVIWRQTFDDRFTERDHAIAVFERHNAQVQAALPAERLLVFDTAQGWEPLCAFLDVAVPDEPFPRLNDATAFQDGLARRRRRILTGRATAAPATAAGIGEHPDAVR
ncbi:sulfotransferase family protein [Actinomadura kijaniata]|uniref:sulfotransferase family protein n=1 Tax=Actinomadura kijaniata TaxID=46161 RepID=UPI00082DD0B9|nr:sulfotransferase family protein [Actinomadura kijaniata]